jgi:hypothetical protein
MRRVMCVSLPAWPLQRFLHTRPAYRDKPVALSRPTCHSSRILRRRVPQCPSKHPVTVSYPLLEGGQPLSTGPVGPGFVALHTHPFCSLGSVLDSRSGPLAAFRDRRPATMQ